MPSSAAMRYAEVAPWPSLAPMLECVWTLEGHARELGGEPQRILPDGRTELILHFGDPFERVAPFMSEPLTLFAGQLRTQLVLRPTGVVRVLGLRFRPHGVRGLLPMSQDELAGAIVGVDEVSPPLARALDAIRDRATTLAQAAQLAQQTLTAFLNRDRLDGRLAFVTREIDGRHGCVSIDQLAAQAGLTRRHLERRFRDHVGISPKRLARIVRFQRAVGFLEHASEAPAAGALTASACGYADQSHFIREFKDLAGCAPTEHLLTKGKLTGFFTRNPS